MAKETGARKIGILGLAFKPGTDDLRESPILEVIAALNADGIEVTIHDTAITVDTPLAGQLAYVRHGSPGLQALAKDLPEMLRDDVSEVVEQSDALIITHKNEQYQNAALTVGNTPVIDVVRLFSDVPQTSAYAGIGW